MKKPLNPLLVVLAAHLVLGWLVAFMGIGDDRLLTHSYGGDLDWDAGSAMWYLWHLKQAALGRAELFFSDRIFYPHGINLVQQDWAPVVGVLSLPFQTLGPVAAFNLQLLVGHVLTGTTTYLLAHRLCRSSYAAFLASVIFTFSEYRLLKAHVHGQPANAHLEFIPLYLLLLILCFRRGGHKYAAGAGLCFFLAAFTSPYQFVFLLIFTAILMSHQLAQGFFNGRRQEPGSGGPNLAQAARQCAAFCLVAGGVAAALAAPVVLLNLEAISGGVQAPDAGAVVPSGAELTSYISATLGGRSGPLLLNESLVSFQGYSVLMLAAMAVVMVRRARAGVWLAAALIFFLLSLGAHLTMDGRDLISLPLFPLLQHIPLVGGARHASRFSAMVTLALALAVALTVALLERGRWISARPWRARALKGLVLLVVIVELLSARARQMHRGEGGPSPLLAPAALERVAREPGDFTLLTYPLEWESHSHSIGTGHFPPTRLLAQQIVHGKRLLTGMGDVIPRQVLDYFRGLRLISDLLRIQRGRDLPSPDQQTRQQAREVVSRHDIRMILLHKGPDYQGASSRTPGAPPPAYRYHTRRALQYLKQVLPLELLEEDSSVILLRVALPSNAPR